MTFIIDFWFLLLYIYILNYVKLILKKMYTIILKSLKRIEDLTFEQAMAYKGRKDVRCCIKEWGEFDGSIISRKVY